MTSGCLYYASYRDIKSNIQMCHVMSNRIEIECCRQYVRKFDINSFFSYIFANWRGIGIEFISLWRHHQHQLIVWCMHFFISSLRIKKNGWNAREMYSDAGCEIWIDAICSYQIRTYISKMLPVNWYCFIYIQKNISNLLHNIENMLWRPECVHSARTLPLCTIHTNNTQQNVSVKEKPNCNSQKSHKTMCVCFYCRFVDSGQPTCTLCTKAEVAVVIAAIVTIVTAIVFNVSLNSILR